MSRRTNKVRPFLARTLSKSHFHTIIVISHIEEIKRMGYDRSIRIVKEDGVSRVQE